MRQTLIIVSVAVLAVCPPAFAQIVQAVNKTANPGEPEDKARAAAAEGESAEGAVVLGQASAQTSGSNTQIGLQAVDLWLTKFVRVYARLTLPTKQEPATKAEDESAETGTAPAPLKPSDNIIKQLVDPYGGILNLSAGYFRFLGHQPSLTARSKDARNAAERIQTLVDKLPIPPQQKREDVTAERVSQVQPDHGAFVDVRGGFKFIDLPKSTGSAPKVGDSQVSVFYTGIAGIKYIHDLYDDTSVDDHGNPNHVAGGLTAGLYAVINYAADVSQSDIFTTALDRRTIAVTGVVGVNLPSTAAITFSVTPWTSDSRLGKTFVFGFDVLRPTKDSAKTADGESHRRPRGFM